MSRYYTGRQARIYNTRLRTFTERTLSEALALVDVAALRSVKTRERARWNVYSREKSITRGAIR